MHTLTVDERQFFRVIANIIGTNPFSADYDKTFELMAPYADLSEQHPANHTHAFYLLNAPLEQHLAQLRHKGLSKVSSVRGRDRKLLESAFIFEVYVHHLEEMDELIQQQLQHDDRPIKVPFAESLINDLMACGFSTEESCRCLALLYQFRRAFHFIGTTLIGNCASMRELRSSLWNNVFTFNVQNYRDYFWNHMEDFSTLIVGETGTGKSAAAEAIGRSGLMLYDKKRGEFSHTLTQAFLPINLSEHPESLIESELFGHRKGAFTGAIDNYDGIFSRCLTNGTLFLDEISEVSESIQVKLLNVLQARRFMPVGSNNSQRFSGRIIAATNRPVAELRKNGKMRDDLFYRLSSDVIHIPTLRERLKENPDELLQLINLLISRIFGIESNVLARWIKAHINKQLPKDYSWPGNVRELEQAVRRILLKKHYGGDAYLGFQHENESRQLPAEEVDAKQLVAGYCLSLYEKYGSYEAVSRIVKLDRRTVKKHIQS